MALINEKMLTINPIIENEFNVGNQVCLKSC